jgi:hypothetical protein
MGASASNGEYRLICIRSVPCSAVQIGKVTVSKVSWRLPDLL